VFSHFHGDHVPLQDANPYQLDLRKLTGKNKGMRIWTKTLASLSPSEKGRAESISSVLSQDFIEAEGKNDRVLAFSNRVPHGGGANNPVTVMMTRIEEDFVFVHASDTQLFSSSTVKDIIRWKPDVVFVDGPPLYLTHKIGAIQIDAARQNALRLSSTAGVLIIDHHLMRNSEGELWLESLKPASGNKIVCGADFMGKPRRLLEAGRSALYKDMPVEKDWHRMYARGQADSNHYLKLASEIYR